VSRSLRAAVALEFLTALGFQAVTSVVRAQPQRPAFRGGVDLVSLSVTATDSSQRYVAYLTQQDFVITENGVPQELSFFAKAGIPLGLALLIDTSASMDQNLATAQEAAIGFVREIGPSDLATIIDFDSRVQTAQPLTNDQRALEHAIRGTAAGGSTALYNAVYIALKELAKLPTGEVQMPRRRAIVVLSDGDDTSSLVSFDEVLDVAARSGTVIYTIGIGPSTPTTTRTGRNDGQFVLRRLAQQTGGRAFFPQNIKDLAGVYADIREELSSQYALAYESTSAQRDGQWRRVAVRVSRPGVVVRTKPGYFAPAK
jgi:Ca-activated chloride channel family protein